jgi:hypothetical protein
MNRNSCGGVRNQARETAKNAPFGIKKDSARALKRLQENELVEIDIVNRIEKPHLIWKP